VSGLRSFSSIICFLNSLFIVLLVVLEIILFYNGTETTKMKFFRLVAVYTSHDDKTKEENKSITEYIQCRSHCCGL